MGDGLEYVATWNSAQMPSEDLHKVTQSLQKQGHAATPLLKVVIERRISMQIVR